MKLWIIYRNYYETNATYSPQIMKDTAIKHNIDAEVYYSEYFNIVFENGIKKLFYKDKKIKVYPDVALFRCYNFELMELLEEKQTHLVNSFIGMKNSRDKYQTKKIATEMNVLTPVFLKANYYTFDNITKFLSVPFIMKDNFGAGGKNVFLIHNEDEFKNALNSSVDFIFEQYIPVSGVDTRVYIVGDKVVGCVERFSTSGDFRSNIRQGGHCRNAVVPEEIKEQSLKIAKQMQLSICSVDYLVYENKYYLCEVNGNASFSSYFKLGYNMQEEFMKYIETIDYVNYWTRLKYLQSLSNDYIFEDRKSKIVISAPHAVSQYFEGNFKKKDLGSGELALKLASENNLSYIIKAKNNGNENVNDNANYYECDYRKQLRKMINKDSILFDIHSLKKDRPEELLLAVNHGININNDNKLLEFIISLFEKNDIKVCVDTIYSASERTISTAMHNEFNIKAIEFEFNSKLTDPLSKSNKINEISKIFKEIINTLS